jgi:hypothetical protein
MNRDVTLIDAVVDAIQAGRWPGDLEAEACWFGHADTDSAEIRTAGLVYVITSLTCASEYELGIYTDSARDDGLDPLAVYVFPRQVGLALAVLDAAIETHSERRPAGDGNRLETDPAGRTGDTLTAGGHVTGGRIGGGVLRAMQRARARYEQAADADAGVEALFTDLRLPCPVCGDTTETCACR